MYYFTNLEPVCCPVSGSKCCFLTCNQISQEAGKVGGLVFPSLEEFSTVSENPYSPGFSVVNEAEVDVFLEFLFIFYDPPDVGSLISGSSAFSKSSLNV